MECVQADEKQISHLLELYPGVNDVLCRGENAYTLIVYKSDEIVAFASAFRRQIPAPVDMCFEDFINVIEVFKESNRQKGLGSIIVQRIIDIAKCNDSIQVRAYCEINNEASHRLWLRNGFGISPVKEMNGNIPGSYVTYRISI